MAAHQGPGYGADGRALSRIAGCGADQRTSSRTAPGATYPFTTAHCRSLLLCRLACHSLRVDPGLLLCPGKTFTFIFALLLGRLSLRGIGNNSEGR
jgi:hypothetical protein